jgi:hypothetical protein
MVEVMDRIYDLAAGLERTNEMCTNRKVAEEIFAILAGDERDDDP